MKTNRIITLCGSSKYVDIMAVCAWILEKREKAMTFGLHFLPYWYRAPKDHLAESEGCANEMDELHRKKIEKSNEIFVVNFNNYIGDSTKMEIEYATNLNKNIRYDLTDYIGDIVTNIILEAKINIKTEKSKN